MSWNKSGGMCQVKIRWVLRIDNLIAVQVGEVLVAAVDVREQAHAQFEV